MRRLRRNCSRDKYFQLQSKMMENRFLEKGYPRPLIKDAILRSAQHTQEMCLQPKTQGIANVKTNPNAQFSMNFLITFNQAHDKIRRIISKHWAILCNEPHLKNSLSAKPRMTFRRAMSLKNILAPSKLRDSGPATPLEFPLKSPGCYRCNKNRCINCRSLVPFSNTFKSTVTQQEYNIKYIFDCSSKYIIMYWSAHVRTRMNKRQHNVTKVFV